jgi:hypothetical protein
MGSYQFQLHVLGPEATAYLPLDVEFTLSLGRKRPSPGTGHEEGPSIGDLGPGPGSARRAYAQARARARARALARARAPGVLGFVCVCEEVEAAVV